MTPGRRRCKPAIARGNCSQLNTLVAYLPIDRLHALARGESLPDRAEGAVLFADIRGFTSLAEALTVALGPRRGAEELTAQLNRVCGMLIAEVHRYGGSVITFGGDAITCWFEGQAAGIGQQASGNRQQATPAIPPERTDDEEPVARCPLPDACSRAVTCALAMQSALGPLGATQTVHGVAMSLAVKIAVVAGPVRRFLVGDPDIQLLEVLAGRTVDRMAAAERLAQPGEVVVDAAIAERLPAQLDVSAWRDCMDGTRFAVVHGLRTPALPAPWPELPAEQPPALAPERLRAWLPRAVYARLRGGQGQFLAELRPVATLFVKFGGIDYHDEQAGPRLDAYVRWVQATLAAEGGHLLELCTGDKGDYLYCTFGAPVAHEDDAAHAVAAAQALLDLPPALAGMDPPRIGLTRGFMCTGAYGAPERRTYGVLGGKANLAAHLMETARPGEILCDQEIYANARGYWAFATLPAVRAKGMENPVNVYKPVAPVAHPSGTARDLRVTPLVGRQAELASLAAGVAALAAGQSRVFIVEGEPGIGKSRLVLELLRLARDRGISALLAGGHSIEQQTPYRAWRDIFQAYFELDDLATQAERRARVQAVVAQHAPEQAGRIALLNDVLALGLPDPTPESERDPSLRRQSLVVLLLALLRACARKCPLLLVFDDAQWLDSLSWELVVEVVRGMLASGDALLVAIATRPLAAPAAGEASLQALRTLGVTVPLSLAACSSSEAVTLAAAQLGLPPEALPAPVAELVRQRAEGNPFHAEELAAALRDRGLIRLEPAEDGTVRCRFAGDPAQGLPALPTTLQDVILARIDRLAPECQVVLKVGAVIGRTFAYRTLRAALQHHTAMDDPALVAHLQTLDALDLAPLATPYPDAIYSFKHSLIQEVAYQTLLFAQRRQLHCTVAEWYEQAFGADTHTLAAYYPLLVYHYGRAEDTARERHYARLAGEQAMASFANAEAVTYLSHALELTPPDDAAEHYALLLARAQVYDLLGKRAQQAGDLDAAQRWADVLADPVRAARLALRRADLADALGKYAEAVAHSQMAVDLAHAAGDVELEARSYLRWGRSLGRQGDYRPAQLWLERGLTLAHAAGAHGVEADILHSLGLIDDEQGRGQAARSRFEQALFLLRTLGNRRGEARALNNLGNVAADQGDYAEARTAYAEALALSQAIGDRRGESLTLGNLGTVSDESGYYVEARAYLEQALLIFREIGHRRGEGLALGNLGLLAHHLGENAAARDYSRQAMSLEQSLNDRSNYAFALTHLGHALAALGERVEAAAAYAEALAVRQELDQPHLVPEVLAGLARTRQDQGDLPGARALVEQILASLDTPGIDGSEEPVRVYGTCVDILRAAGDARAEGVLARGLELLIARAARITDETVRRSFLENVPAHRALGQAARPTLLT